MRTGAQLQKTKLTKSLCKEGHLLDLMDGSHLASIRMLTVSTNGGSNHVSSRFVSPIVLLRFAWKDVMSHGNN